MKSFLGLLLRLVAIAVPCRASAAPPAWTANAIVPVSAHEHLVAGAVVGDGAEVPVPFRTIEVDRAGDPDAFVIGAANKRIPAPERETRIFYVALGLDLQIANGSGGVGPSAGLAARWRELLEARVELSFVFAGSNKYPGNCDDGQRGTCLNATRAGMSPSLGVRLPLAGERDLAFAMTPFVGMSFGVESSLASHLPSSTWALFAPGFAASLGHAELRFRVAIPRGDTTTPMFDFTFGAMF